MMRLKPGALALGLLLAVPFSLGTAQTGARQVSEDENAPGMSPIYSGPQDPVGRKLLELGNFAEAAEHYRRLLSRDPNNPEACIGLGISLCYMNNIQESMLVFNDCLVRMPDQPELYVARGVCVQTRDGDLAAPAEADYLKALSLDPANSSAHNQLGLIYQARGQHPAAISQFQAAIKSDPGKFEAYNNLAISLIALGRYDEAIYILQKTIAIKEDLKGVYLYTNLGIAFLRSGRPARAEAAFLMETAINPEHLPAHLYLANLYSMSGRYQDAISEYNRVLLSDPQNLDALINLGITQLQAGRPRIAVIQLRRAVEFHPESAAAHYHLSRAYAAIGETPKAEAERQKALELGYQEKP